MKIVNNIKYKILMLFLISTINCISQSKKETVYILFDGNSKEKCRLEVEYSSDNDGRLDGYQTVNKYRKKYKNNRIIFEIYNENFVFDKQKFEPDTCSVQNFNKIKLETIESINKKVKDSDLGYLFKNSLFNKIYLVEKISETRIIKYEVYWAGELTSE
ncbi:hypothetical protein Lupro_09115 [Lutibacter profundi]|uniref:Uncharacterized protein n=1 Tax=Lutibacter profundi TaxID=1622118 RepID=A0A120IEE4_9FLAO|nr:hypothetical protein [Lutibacter profundi]AMC11411.1 hypothetical protein Lupro_09115 [Lutibacter profundi]